MNKCRNCGAEKKEGVEWYDETYCSGKCKASDGGVIPKSHTSPITQKSTLVDYKQDKRNMRYRRRFDPDKLNWGEPMDATQLKQAGLRANRKPIPGDWDFVVEVADNG